MAETASQRIVKKFAELFNLKFTQKLFKVQLGQANSLLKTGFSESDIILTLEYLKKHPPAKGISSLAYLQYVINDIVPKATVEQMKAVEEYIFGDTDVPEKSDNISKYNAVAKRNMKGIGRF